MSQKNNFSASEKINYLQTLGVALSRKLKKIERLKQIANFYKPCNIGVIVQRCFLGAGIGEEGY